MVQSSPEGQEVREVMRDVGAKVWDWLSTRPASSIGVRG